jgi:hypothetical protein
LQSSLKVSLKLKNHNVPYQGLNHLQTSLLRLARKERLSEMNSTKRP